MAEETRPAQEYWDDRYRENGRLWSGMPSAALVREVHGLTPGSALELGCGEGADAVWLALTGWRVTAVDISAVALERARAHAAERGLGERVEWQRHDLAVSFPEGTYDLVCALFLHSTVALPRERILRRAAAAVAPGGTLLVVGHAGWPRGVEHDHEDRPEVHFPTPAEVFASLELPEGAWEVRTDEEYERVRVLPDGREMHHLDNTLKIRRLPHPAG
ncbi:class I SAM-dependent methyltransferase [Streptomyces sp. NPDC059853]|uniref:class I SAM-dependent methyltransferase n=1 Tax=Streptomyces sp. NPDC059853 TaxID=3346973 RepID=UPI00366620B6